MAERDFTARMQGVAARLTVAGHRFGSLRGVTYWALRCDACQHVFVCTRIERGADKIRRCVDG